MKIFLLTAKNWILSIKKLKFVFAVFLLINLIFAAAFTIFLEVNSQINKQVVLQEDKNKNTKNIWTLDENLDSLVEENEYFAEDSRFYQLFCTDYLEIKDEIDLPFFFKKVTWMKRFPILTFGGEEGCFKKITFDLDWETITVKLEWFDPPLPYDLHWKKIQLKSIWFKSQDYQDILKINTESDFYQKSVHGQLMKKYQETKDSDYVNLAKQIEEVFFPKIIKNLEKELLRRANQTNLPSDSHVEVLKRIKEITPKEMQKYNREYKELLLKNAWFDSSSAPTDNTDPFFKKKYQEKNWFNSIVGKGRGMENLKSINFLGPIKKEEFELFLKATLQLNNLKWVNFQKVYFRDQQNNESYLMIELNGLFKLNIIKGREPVLDNEILISPMFARNWNLKVGDKVSLMGLGNLRIVGIGIQKKLIYPIISPISVIPKKNEGIFYITKNSYQNFFSKAVENPTQNRYFSKTQQLFILSKSQDSIQQNMDFVNWKKMVDHTGTSFTRNSLEIHDQWNQRKKNEYVDDFNYSSKIKTTLLSAENNRVGIPEKMITLNNQILSYSALGMVIICLLIISFVSFYMAWQKIDNNRKEIGVLKSLGMKTSVFLFGSLPLTSFLFAAVFLGWIAGVLLQIPIFNTIENLFNFQFEKYNFNFSHLFINFGITLGIIVLSFWFFYIFKLSRMSVSDLIYKKKQKSKEKIFWLTKLIIKKTGLSKYLLVKINYIFFSTIWKKMVVLTIVFLILTTSLTGNILLFTMAERTKDENYKTINHNYEIVYSKPLANNPLSRKKIIVNKGYDDTLKNKEDSFNPLEKDTLKLFAKEADKNQYELKWESAKEMLWFILPMHWRTANINLLKAHAKQGSSYKEKEMCRLIFKFVKHLKKIKDKDTCLTTSAGNFLPFKLEDAKKATSQIPFSVGGVQFNPEKDELFTTTYGYKNLGNDDKFSIYGLNENTKALKISPQIQKTVFSEKISSEDLTKKTINVLVNNTFLKKFNLKVGDKFTALLHKSKLTYNSKKNYKQIYFDTNDWFYEDVYNHLSDNPAKKTYSFDDIDDDVQFYNGKLLNQSINFVVEENKVKYKGKEIKLMYKNSKNELKPMLDINNVKLKLDSKEVVSPFSPTLEEKKVILDQKISWFARQIINGNLNIFYFPSKPVSLQIAGSFKEINEPRIFMNQGTLNGVMDWSTKKNSFGQYKWFNGRFSKSEKIQNVFYNVPISTEYGYSGIDVVDNLKNKNILDIKGIRAVGIEKQTIETLTKYLINMILIFLINEIAMILVFFIFLVINIIRSIKNNELKLKLFGYSNKIIMLQLIQIIFLPFLVGFVLGTFTIRFFLKYVLQHISEIVQFEIFFDEKTIWSVAVFGFITLILIFLLWKNYKQMQKVNLQKLIQEN